MTKNKDEILKKRKALEKKLKTSIDQLSSKDKESLQAIAIKYDKDAKKAPTIVASGKGKIVRIKFATQVSNEPLVIAFYVNYPRLIKESYKRYLENQIREYFNLKGVPIKLSFRKK